MTNQQFADDPLIRITANIVAAQVGSNTISSGDVPNLIISVHQAFSKIAKLGLPGSARPAPVPAVPIRSSVKRDYIVCLEDGKKLKMLKRYLKRQFKMTPAEYREKWNLPADYPMVAPAYTEQRSALAKSFGLGKGPRTNQPASA